MLALDADAFAALGCQDVGMAGVGVAPAMVFLHVASQAGLHCDTRPALADHDGRRVACHTPC